MPTSLTTIASAATAEIQAATTQVIVVRRILATKSAILEIKADSTEILPQLQYSQSNVDVRFDPAEHPPTVAAGAALNIRNAGVASADVWVHWELV